MGRNPTIHRVPEMRSSAEAPEQGEIGVRGSDLAELSPIGFESARGYLRAVYERRSLKNPAYSLRAFARNLGISSSFIVDLLQGRRRLSKEAADEIAECLGLKNAQRDYFLIVNARDSTKKVADYERLSAKAHSIFLSDSWAGNGKKKVEIDAERVSTWLHFVLFRLYN